MQHRVKTFIITFLAVGAFVFGFYYLDTQEFVHSIFLGIIGGTVVGAIAAILVPFVIKGQKHDAENNQ